MTGRYPTEVFGVGLHYGATDQSMPLLDTALAAEERGFDSMFLPEHTHIPTSRRTPYPGGGDIPGRYLRLWDPLVALGFVAARTNLVVGTCVCLPGEHDPIAMAKAVATLDVQSGGRFVMGVGFGWNNEEFEDHGYPAEHKRAVAIEKIKMMQALWTQDEASFEGVLVAAIQEVSTEVGEGGAVLEEVVADDEDRVGDGDDRFLLAAPRR